MRLEIGIAGDQQVSRKLLRIGERAVAARPAFEAIGEMLLGLEREQFDTEGQRASGGWAPLAASTAAARGADHPILNETGELRASLTERGANNTFWTTDEFLLFGSKVPYSGFHQTGTSRMPRRRPLELKETDRIAAVKILQSHILGHGLTGMAAELAG